MKIACYITDTAYRPGHIARAMAAGFLEHGIQPKLLNRYNGVEADVAVAYGWRNQALFEPYRAAGAHFLYIDLGYWERKPQGLRWDGYHKVVLDGWCPAATMARGCKHDRLAALRLPGAAATRSGRSIVLAGMSAKSASHHGLRAEEWERKTLAKLTRISKRPIIYRPKPSWEGAQPLTGATFDRNKDIADTLRHAHALVTHHSNAAIDAMLAGVPVYCEAGVGKIMSMPALTDIDNPPLATVAARQQFAADIAYCQFSVSEMRQGICWEHMRTLLPRKRAAANNPPPGGFFHAQKNHET